MDCACLARKSRAAQADGPAQASAVSTVRVPTFSFATCLLLLWARRRGAALGRDNPCAGSIDKQYLPFTHRFDWRSDISGVGREAEVADAHSKADAQEWA